ncbi:MAG: carboxy terminal-processing peptidase [Kofleriaceae bacterium]
MTRCKFGVLLTLALLACSQKPPASSEPPGTDQSDRKPTDTSAAVVPPPDPREAALSQAVLRLLETQHLLQKKITDEVSREAFTSYLERLDGGKMYLLRSDREALGKYSDKMDDELRSGSLELAHDGAKIFATRVAQVEAIVAGVLSKPMDFSNEEYFELDAKKSEPAATEQELTDRWRRRLEVEVLERVASMEDRLKPDKSGKKDPKAPKDPDKDAEDRAMPISQIPTTPEAREAKVRGDLAKSYSGRFARLKNPGPLDAASDFMNAIAATIDPHTTYLPPADKANFDIQMSGSLEGIGAVLRERDHYIEVIEIVPGGASWKQGDLEQGDLILSVANEGADPVDTFDMRIDEVVKMIRGKKGTVVRIRVQKPTGSEESISITRDVVVVEETYARAAILTRKGLPALGYIHLPSFYGGKGSPREAADDVRRLLGELRKAKVPGVVIDLRSNGGGILGDAIEMTGSLIDTGPVVQVQDNEGQRETLSDDRKGIDYDGNVVLMVDKFSASASEIVAGALQDYGRAVIVGTGPTHGKGTVQTLADLDRLTGGKVELGSFKITIQQFFRVSGSSTQREGVKPDITLPDPYAHVDSGERELDHAIAWSQIPAAPYQKWKGTWNTSALAQKSAARVTKHPELSRIATTTQVLRARQKDTRVPLAKTTWEARRKELRTALEAANPDPKTVTAKFTVKAVDDPLAVAKAPNPSGRTDDRAKRWGENLSKDVWIEESLNILADIK